MRTEVSRTRPGELLITLDASELGGQHEDSCLRRRLPGAAAELADQVLAMLAHPAEPEPAEVSVVTIRLTRSVTVAETILMLAEPVEVFA